jgi:pimeloyl-ACP methyl ester carboxylesterase
MMSLGGYRRMIPLILEDALPNMLRNPSALWRVGNLARIADLTGELADLKKWKVPVLVLWGDHDQIITEASFRDLCMAIGAKGEVIDGSHSWLLADPDAFGQVMTNVVQVAKVAKRQKEKERLIKPRSRTGRPGQGSERLPGAL